MKINGKERGFEFNVQAHKEISEHCPGGDLGRMGELYEKSSDEKVQADIMIAIALNRGYEDHRHYEDTDYVPDYLTEDDFRFMHFSEIAALENEITSCMTKDNRISVETQPVKSSKNAKKAKA